MPWDAERSVGGSLGTYVNSAGLGLTHCGWVSSLQQEKKKEFDSELITSQASEGSGH